MFLEKAKGLLHIGTSKGSTTASHSKMTKP